MIYFIHARPGSGKSLFIVYMLYALFLKEPTKYRENVRIYSNIRNLNFDGKDSFSIEQVLKNYVEGNGYCAFVRFNASLKAGSKSRVQLIGRLFKEEELDGEVKKVFDVRSLLPYFFCFTQYGGNGVFFAVDEVQGLYPKDGELGKKFLSCPLDELYLLKLPPFVVRKVVNKVSDNRGRTVDRRTEEELSLTESEFFDYLDLREMPDDFFLDSVPKVSLYSILQSSFVDCLRDSEGNISSEKFLEAKKETPLTANNFYEKHRHFGVNIFSCSQDASQVSSSYKSVVEESIVLTNFRTFGLRWFLLLRRYKKDGSYIGLKFKYFRKSLREYLFKRYDTRLFEGEELRLAVYPYKLIFLLTLFLLLFSTSIYFVFKTVHQFYSLKEAKPEARKEAKSEARKEAKSEARKEEKSEARKEEKSEARKEEKLEDGLGFWTHKAKLQEKRTKLGTGDFRHYMFAQLAEKTSSFSGYYVIANKYYFSVAFESSEPSYERVVLDQDNFTELGFSVRVFNRCLLVITYKNEFFSVYCSSPSVSSQHMPETQFVDGSGSSSYEPLQRPHLKKD